MNADMSKILESIVSLQIRITSLERLLLKNKLINKEEYQNELDNCLVDIKNQLNILPDKILY